MIVLHIRTIEYVLYQIQCDIMNRLECKTVNRKCEKKNPTKDQMISLIIYSFLIGGLLRSLSNKLMMYLFYYMPSLYDVEVLRSKS